MPGPFGISFAPTEDAAAEASRQPGYGGQHSQAALKVLRLTPPAVYSSTAPAANALLQPRTAITPGGSPDAAVLGSIVKSLLGPNAVMPSAPSPLTTPAAGSPAPPAHTGSPRLGPAAVNESGPLARTVAETPSASPVPTITFRGEDDAPPIVRAPVGPFPGGRTDVTPQTPTATTPGRHVGPFGGDVEALSPIRRKYQDMRFGEALQ